MSQRTSPDTSGVLVQSPAMRAAAIAVETSFDPMCLCTADGTPVISNHGYDHLAMHLGPRSVTELLSGALVQPGTVVAIAMPEAVRCHARVLDVSTGSPMYVVAFHREHTPRDLVLPKAAVREVLQHLRHVLQLLDTESPADDPTGPSDALTVKEEEVLAALMAGYRVPTIARDFHVSQSTVRSHLRSIFQKYDVHSQAALFEKLLGGPRPS